MTDINNINTETLNEEELENVSGGSIIPKEILDEIFKDLIEKSKPIPVISTGR